MKEYDLGVLEQYDMEVRSTRRIRGAFFCDTNQGIILLKETTLSDRRACLLYAILNRLEENSGLKVDTPVFTKTGELICTAKDGGRYMCKKWFAGRECDVAQRSDIIRACRQLAVIHLSLGAQEAESFREEKEEILSTGHLPWDEVRRHNRELKKVRAFIRNRVSKNEFEQLFLTSFDTMYDLAEKVAARLESDGCRALYRRNIEKNTLIHGDYNYHNVLMLADTVAVTNFEHMRRDIQAQDLCYFLRKVMEKHQWDEEMGKRMLDAYQSVRPLQRGELDYIGLNLAYPEKFWKTASTYYHSNKAWIPEKSVEKLQLSVRQAKEKLDFLEHIFTLNL